MAPRNVQKQKINNENKTEYLSVYGWVVFLLYFPEKKTITNSIALHTKYLIIMPIMPCKTSSNYIHLYLQCVEKVKVSRNVNKTFGIYSVYVRKHGNREH